MHKNIIVNLILIFNVAVHHYGLLFICMGLQCTHCHATSPGNGYVRQCLSLLENRRPMHVVCRSFALRYT